MSMRAIVTKTIAGVALTSIGAGAAAGTADAKPRACAGMEQRMNDAIYLAHAAHDQGDWDGRNYWFDAAERINKRYEAAGCRA